MDDFCFSAFRALSGPPANGWWETPRLLPPPANASCRDWRRNCPSPDDKYRYLKLCGPEGVRAVFRVEVSRGVVFRGQRWEMVQSLRRGNDGGLLLGEAQWAWAEYSGLGLGRGVGQWPRHPGSGVPQGTSAGAQPWHAARESQRPVVATM